MLDSILGMVALNKSDALDIQIVGNHIAIHSDEYNYNWRLNVHREAHDFYLQDFSKTFFMNFFLISRLIWTIQEL